ncbi:UDP-N-acetylmuramate:L-alanyl-gamma-D-glutamyl-meso-diaminopimelate ligase [Carnimonas nigrificans]|uniref:UDP-N-acetylmuramate:L-alanyl-gamma-D-glutamyl- meso-diaminopimelate ligase n=1 Tax=Carnimonas nigrificans TaxID=64323 RepID=UPI000470456E|nr:UDP-N-acetylmuramate:L-alanyl-gamma-D-glutamyl-meso-diaminopimelate ligase [Carnimonas nigrificans]
MHIHVVGICGTFMGSLALLARAQGHRVTGSDANVYPPMSTQLEEQGITLIDGFSADNLSPRPDLVVIGNALSRGNPEVEAVLDQRLHYVSGPQLLREQVLGDRQVLAVAGTHGKTTTVSMLAWILEFAGMKPGFLIGGVPGNFEVSARIGDQQAPFVVEADEYDSAFFDKRSKFVHYRPDVAVLNNLEYDHADIFPDLAAIKRQFHHLVRTVPGSGQLLVAAEQPALERVLEMGCWTPVARFGDSPDSDWQLLNATAGGQCFTLRYGDQTASVEWNLSGSYNQHNALAAAAAAYAVGVPLATAAQALCHFKAPRRRQEVRGSVAGVTVMDDFAHHPTAIAQTLEGLQARHQQGRVLAVIEPRSNTMKLGAMRDRLADAAANADAVYWYQPPHLDWSLDEVAHASKVPAQVFTSIEALIAALIEEAQPGDLIVGMSNGSFDGFHQKLLDALAQQ